MLNEIIMDKRKIIVLIATIIVGIIILEGASYIIIKQLHTQEKADTNGLVIYYKDFALHPYLGYVWDGDRKENISKYGFGGFEDFVKNKDGFIIGVTGGSVAEGFCAYSGLEELLGHDTRVVCISLGSYKQPQQLMTLVYFLSLGAKFDMIINIDGYNDAMLGTEYNYPNTAISYPYMWKYRMRIASDPTANSMAQEYVRLLEKVKYLERQNSSNPLINLIQKIELNLKLKRFNNIGQEMMDYIQKSDDFKSSGPLENYKDKQEALEDAADLWARSSEQMNALSRGNNISYFHFLHPNQYYKYNMSEEEKKVAYANDYFAGEVNRAYTFLVKKEAELKQKGVPFYDATNIFQNESGLYTDVCCHFNQEGYRIFGEYVAATIKNRLETFK